MGLFELDANLQYVTLLRNLSLLYMGAESAPPPPATAPSPQLHECEALPNLEGLGLNYKGVQFQTQHETKQEHPND